MTNQIALCVHSCWAPLFTPPRVLQVGIPSLTKVLTFGVRLGISARGVLSLFSSMHPDRHYLCRQLHFVTKVVTVVSRPGDQTQK